MVFLLKIKSYLGKRPYVFFFLFALLLAYFPANYFLNEAPVFVDQEQKVVLGEEDFSPELYISGWSKGGLISLASTEEPAIFLKGSNVLRPVKVNVYEANEDLLFNYLLHDEEGKFVGKAPDESKLRLIATLDHDVNSESQDYMGSKVVLPLEDVGIWFVKAEVANTSVSAFVLRSNVGVLVVEGDDEFVFWGQNFKTKRSVSSGTLTLMSLENRREDIKTISMNPEGISKSKLDSNVDVAVFKEGENISVVPINLSYFDYGSSYSRFRSKELEAKYFLFTDRPLYKPGDTVYFKSIARSDDDARYTIPKGLATIKISDGSHENENILFEKSYPVSSDGTVSGEFQLPKRLQRGTYYIFFTLENHFTDGWRSYTNFFDVQDYQKPEFFVDISIPQDEYISGDLVSFDINGNYFSGQPMSKENFEYIITSERETVKGDTIVLDKYGRGQVKFDTKLSGGESRVFDISASKEDGSVTPSFDTKNIFVHAGEYDIYRTDYSYGSRIKTPLSVPIKLTANTEDVNLSGVRLTAEVERTYWLSFQKDDEKRLSYEKKVEKLPPLFVETDKEGHATFTFVPEKTGSYNLSIKGEDARGNSIRRIFYAYVSDDDEPGYLSEMNYNGAGDLTVTPDKQEYLPTDTAKLTIFSRIPDRDVFLSFERGRLDRFQVVKMKGKNALVEVPLVETDIPNTFANVRSFSVESLQANSTEIPVSAEGKKILVDISPSSKTFGPGETVSIDILTTDVNGNGIPAELALWSVDKAIFELSNSKLGDIFSVFWSKRWESTSTDNSLTDILTPSGTGAGGCFVSGTQVLMADGTTKNIENVKVGDKVLTRTEKESKLVKAKVLGVKSAQVSGHIIINSSLKLTENHRIRVNDSWQEAGSVQLGDYLVDSEGEKIKVESLEWQRGKFTVHNLHIEKYNTYFAGDVWVHNSKGGARSFFKDTAYWNPSIYTDSSGKAKVSFKLPDNLTTWTIAAVATTKDTKVGQSTTEIVVTKDVILRPILPNILRKGDEIVLSALVQNFTDVDSYFDVNLDFDSGEIEENSLLLPERSNVLIKSNDMEQFYWRVKPNVVNEKAKLTFSVLSKDNDDLKDIIIQEIPVEEFGFEQKRGQVGEGSQEYQIEINPFTNKEESSVILSLSPTMLGTLPSAMEYLIDYPYGCMEQTTSRLVPAIIAKRNPSLFKKVLEQKDVDNIIEDGLDRLMNHRHYSGGWAWWNDDDSDPFVTAYVVEYILEAKQAGYEINPVLLEETKDYLESKEYYDHDLSVMVPVGKEEMILKNYSLILFDEKENIEPIKSFDNLTPDILSILVMSNFLNGDKNPQTNGLNKLISLGQESGQSLSWGPGKKENFGSRDASTALALRAILLAGGDREFAIKAMRHLTQTRKFNKWSNTFATAQAVRALVEFGKTGDELNPQYSYTVNIDGEELTAGKVISAEQQIDDLKIPLDKIRDEGSTISISQDGKGSLYSTLIIDEFITDTNAQAVMEGMSVKKEFVNEKGEEYTLGVGDTAIVRMTIVGLGAENYYGILVDELPSGLVPINRSLLNERWGEEGYNNFRGQAWEITENGIILSLNNIEKGGNVYTYKARVVSEGSFIVPPVTVSLMYNPEVYGSSEVGRLFVSKESGRMIVSKESGKMTVGDFLDLDKRLFLYGYGKKDMSWLLPLFIVLALVSVPTIFLLRKNKKFQQFFRDFIEKLRKYFSKFRIFKKRDDI